MADRRTDKQSSDSDPDQFFRDLQLGEDFENEVLSGKPKRSQRLLSKSDSISNSNTNSSINSNLNSSEDITPNEKTYKEYNAHNLDRRIRPGKQSTRKRYQYLDNKHTKTATKKEKAKQMREALKKKREAEKINRCMPVESTCSNNLSPSHMANVNNGCMPVEPTCSNNFSETEATVHTYLSPSHMVDFTNILNTNISEGVMPPDTSLLSFDE